MNASQAELCPHDSGCVFCIARDDPELMDEVENSVLYETDHFFVVPTLGAFVEGYLLICSKCHFDNFFSLPEFMEKEFKLLKRKVSEVLEENYGALFLFEHGGGGPERDSGAACIDHAHLHVIPTRADVRGLVQSSGTRVPCLIEDLPPQLRGKSNYFYFESKLQGEALLLTDRPPRQFIRKLVCVACTRFG